MRWGIVMTACLLAAVLASPALAQDAEAPEQLLEDFVHYAQIARPDLAAGYAEKLLQSGLTNAELAILLDEGRVSPKRFEAAVLRALLVAELEDLAGELTHRIEQGRLDLARNGDRIDEAIGMLTGTQRQKMLATSRLEAAGEYAVPALLLQVTDSGDDLLRQAAMDMIVKIGLPAVAPLCAAAPNVDPASKRIVCDLLGEIGYPQAAPYLLELATSDSSDMPVKMAADRAYRAVGAVGGDLSDQYARLARQYYDGLASLVAYPYEESNNIWSYDSFVGLVPTPVPTVIFNEVMAMRLAAHALQLDRDNRNALALYVAADLKRANDLPEDGSDPIYGAARYTPEFYATVFGTEICQDVLGLAIDTNDTPLIRDAMSALAQTTGGSNLFDVDDPRTPLLEAVQYPDRRVQYESSLILARALPDRGFEGDFRVVPLLASAVRTGNESFALVVADDEENRRQAVNDLEGQGFTVVGAEPSVAMLAGALADAIGIDLVVVRLGTPEAATSTVGELRGVAKTGAAPVLILASGVDAGGLDRQYRADDSIMVSRPGIGETALTNVINALMEKASGGRMTEAEAEAYAFEALGALEDISIACSPAYSIADAEYALLEALDTRTGRARLLVAGILARIDSDRAQRTLFDAALAATGGERIDLLDRVAESVKRFGDRAEKRHIDAVLNLVQTSTGSTAEAAARVYGALNLQTPEAVELIDG